MNLCIRSTGVCLLLAGGVLLPAGAQPGVIRVEERFFPVPGSPQRATRPTVRTETPSGVLPSDDPRAAEVRLTDGGVLRVNLLDTDVTLVTPFGKLQIPLEQIHRIEFAQRVPEELRKKAEKLIGTLGSSEFQDREAASKELLKIGEQIWPILAKATEGSDPEVSQRISDVLSQIRSRLPDDQQELRTTDVVHTADSKITGKLEGVEFKTSTSQFGEQTLKLSDVTAVRRLNASSGEDDAGGPVIADPGSLTQFHTQIGKTLRIRVTGAIGGSIWGSGPYTTDSTLATAAVHAGVLRVGQTGIVRVTMVASPGAFSGTSKNGVTSYDFGDYPAAYRLRK